MGPGCKEGVCFATGGDESLSRNSASSLRELAKFLSPPVAHVPGLNLKHAGPKLSRVRPKIEIGGLLESLRRMKPGTVIGISGLKISPVDERQAKPLPQRSPFIESNASQKSAQFSQDLQLALTFMTPLIRGLLIRTARWICLLCACPSVFLANIEFCQFPVFGKLPNDL